MMFQLPQAEARQPGQTPPPRIFLLDVSLRTQFLKRESKQETLEKCTMNGEEKTRKEAEIEERRDKRKEEEGNSESNDG